LGLNPYFGLPTAECLVGYVGVILEILEAAKKRRVCGVLGAGENRMRNGIGLEGERTLLATKQLKQ